jgi:thymidylate synthase
MQKMENPAEQAVLDLIDRVWTQGSERVDRTGVGTRAVFGAMLRFDLSAGQIPLITTKRIAWKVAARELLWFLTGDTGIRPLIAQGVHIWTDWPLDRYRRETGEAIDRKDFEARILADDGFAREWGDLGPVYGRQWRRWRGSDGIEHDQIAKLIAGLRDNPSGRRHLFTGWNVAELAKMALPPCHMTYQFFVDGKRLSCLLYQRSCDLGLGFPFNIFEASLLTAMIAQQAELEPAELVWTGADVHLYRNHGHLVAALLERTPRAFPTLALARRPSIDDYRIEDIMIQGYDPHPHVPAPVAV